MLRTLPPLLALALAPALLLAQGLATALPPLRAPEAGAVRARRLVAGVAGGRLVLDGRLDEVPWAGAAVATGFVQQRPAPGARATHATEARVLVDGDVLWIGLRMEEPDPRGPATALGRRDYALPSDWVHVLIDSWHDRRTAFRFSVNPAGVLQDALVSGDNEHQQDAGWNAVWDAATARDARAWTAELRIPLSQLRFGAGGDSTRTFGLQVARDHLRANERSVWAPIPAGATGYVSLFGTLADVRVARPRRRLELVPYAVLRADRAPVATGDPLARAGTLTPTVGADLQLGVTPDLTLTASLLPDFGQVEADPSEVNLSGVETFFAEQRPFFMEGAELFSVPLLSMPWLFGRTELFYSRRIGRRPQVGVPDAAQWSELPGATRVLGAAKLTGRTAGGWSLGVLDALTAEERAAWAGDDRARREAVVEPLTNHALVRARRDFRAGWSAVGATVTATHRRLTPSTADVLRGDAVVAAVDARHRLDADHQVGGSIAASRVGGTPAAIARTQRSMVHLFQRPDAGRLDYDTTRTMLAGAMADARIARTGGGMLRWGLAGSIVTPGFEANDLGFQASADQLSAGGWVGLVGLRPTRLARRWEAWSNAWSQATLGGERRLAGASQFVFVERPSGGALGVELRRNLDALAVTALRGGPALATPATTQLWARLTSDPRRPLVGEVEAWGRRADVRGPRAASVSPTLRVRPSPRAEVAVTPSLSWTHDPAQYVTTATDAGGADRWVVGDLRQATAAVGVRASYTFTRDLTLQAWAQPFASAGRYGALREVRAPRARAFDRRFRTFAADAAVRDASGNWRVDRDGDGTGDYTVGNPDFHVRELRSNAVLRWEFRPGSALFLVWAQQRAASDDDAPFGLARDARALAGAPARNTLLAKVSWWGGR